MGVRYAVVFKTYAWDTFVHDQAVRCAAATGAGDFFVSVDETNGPVGEIPFSRVVRTNNAEICELGFADRFEKGCLLWWNPDYTHYHFYQRYPEYEYYVFIEYDAVVQGSLDELISRIAEVNADLVALPIRENKMEWCWTRPHLEVYSLEEIQGSLMCISVHSGRALDLLARRRREMSATNTAYWPSAEVFMPTEILAAGYRYRSLEEFGDVTRFDWSPPILERDLCAEGSPAFLHPVLDQRRYMRWAVQHTFTLPRLLQPRSQFYKAIAPFTNLNCLPTLVVEILRYCRVNGLK